MATPDDKRRIVLVDDEEVLAWSLANRLAKARTGYAVQTANDGETALASLEERRADLLVADVRMPGMSGIDLVLAARSLYPDLPVVVMTAFKSADVQRIAGGPFTAFLEKPFEFERLLELVDEALAPAQVGFSGAISVQTLPDVVQLYALSSATGMLSIRHRSGFGELWFEQGTILHAVTSTARGDEAFYEIMTWSGGEFGMRAGLRSPMRSIVSSWQELLIESCRRMDEKSRTSGARSSRTGWTQRPPSAPQRAEAPAAYQDDDDPVVEFEFHLDEGSMLPPPIPTIIPSGPMATDSLEATMNIKDSLAKLNQIDGFIGAALVDGESGMLLGQEGGGTLNLEVAAAGNTEVIKAKRKTMTNLGFKDGIEDMLITLGKQYHLIRPLRTRTTLFFYVALERSRANLAMARLALADVEKDLQV